MNRPTSGRWLRQLTHQGPNEPRLFAPGWGGGENPVRVSVHAAEGTSLYLGALDADGSDLQVLHDPTSGTPLIGTHPRWTSTGP